MIKAIISDYDGVLIPDEYRGTHLFCPDEALLETIESGYYSKTDCSEMWNELRRKLNITQSDTELREFYNAEDEEQLRHEKQVLGIYSDALSYTKSLLLLLSNQITDRTNYLRKKSYLSLFDQLYFSNEIYLQKPQAEIFQFVLERHKLLPNEAIFIDDSLINIQSAERLGMQTILFRNCESLKQELYSLL